MARTEELISGLVKEITGGTHTKYHTVTGEEVQIDWTTPFARIDIIPTLEEKTGSKFPPADTLHTPEATEFLKKLIKDCNVNCTPPLTNARMLDALIGEYLESACVNPTFLLNQLSISILPLLRDDRFLCCDTEDILHPLLSCVDPV